MRPRPAEQSAQRRVRTVGAPRGPRKPDLRSAALLDAATSLFAENGVDATSIDSIVERAGVAKGTFYHYFEDRAAMLTALRLRYSQHQADVVAAAFQTCATMDWSAQLDAWIFAVVAEYASNHRIHRAFLHDADVIDRCNTGNEPVVQQLVRLFEQGMRAGSWFVVQPEKVAIFLYCGLRGLVDEAIATGTEISGIAPFLSCLFAKAIQASAVADQQS